MIWVAILVPITHFECFWKLCLSGLWFTFMYSNLRYTVWKCERFSANCVKHLFSLFNPLDKFVGRNHWIVLYFPSFEGRGLILYFGDQRSRFLQNFLSMLPCGDFTFALLNTTATIHIFPNRNEIIVVCFHK